MAALGRLAGMVLPAWAKWLVLVAVCVAAYGLGRLHEARRGVDAMGDYLSAQAARTVAIGQAQAKVVVSKEIEYRDRIQKIYLKGEVIEKQVPVYVTAADNAECRINAGFVRTYDAAWSGESTGSPAESDREPAGVSLADVAEVDAFNATVCRAWRAKAIGIQEFYEEQQAVTK